MNPPSASFARGTTARVSSAEIGVIVFDAADDHPFLQLVREIRQITGVSQLEAASAAIEEAFDALRAP